MSIERIIPRNAGGFRLPNDPGVSNVPLYGADANTIRMLTLDLSVPNISKEIKGVVGNFFWVIDASSLAATASIKLDHDQGESFDISKGFFLSGIRSNKFILTNAAQVGASLRVMYGVAQNPSLTIVNPSSAASTVELTKATTPDSLADVSAVGATTTQIVSANSSRREILVHNNSAAVTLRIGDSGAGAANGIPLPPGTGFVFSTSGDLYAYNPDAGAVTVALLSIED